MKKILIHTSYFFILLLVSTLLLTIIDYFSLFNIKIIRGIKLLIPVLSLAIISYILGKSALKKPKSRSKTAKTAAGCLSISKKQGRK